MLWSAELRRYRTVCSAVIWFLNTNTGHLHPVITVNCLLMVSPVTILGTSTAISESFLFHLRYFVISHLLVIVFSSGFRLRYSKCLTWTQWWEKPFYSWTVWRNGYWPSGFSGSCSHCVHTSQIRSASCSAYGWLIHKCCFNVLNVSENTVKNMVFFPFEFIAHSSNLEPYSVLTTISFTQTWSE